MPKRIYGHDLIKSLKQYLGRETFRMGRTSLEIDGVKIFNLQELVNLLRSIDPTKIQDYSDNDVFSSWLDRKGYADLADELRPIQGIGPKFAMTLADIIERWMRKYRTSEQAK